MQEKLYTVTVAAPKHKQMGKNVCVLIRMYGGTVTGRGGIGGASCHGYWRDI